MKDIYLIEALWQAALEHHNSYGYAPHGYTTELNRALWYKEQITPANDHPLHRDMPTYRVTHLRCLDSEELPEFNHDWTKTPINIGDVYTLKSDYYAVTSEGAMTLHNGATITVNDLAYTAFERSMKFMNVTIKPDRSNDRTVNVVIPEMELQRIVVLNTLV